MTSVYFLKDIIITAFGLSYKCPVRQNVNKFCFVPVHQFGKLNTMQSDCQLLVLQTHKTCQSQLQQLHQVLCLHCHTPDKETANTARSQDSEGIFKLTETSSQASGLTDTLQSAISKPIYLGIGDIPEILLS